MGFDATPLPLPNDAPRTPTALVPLHRFDELAELAEACGKAVAEGGYDVHGALSDLVPVRPGSEEAGAPSAEELLLASTRDLSAALDGLERLRVRCAALEERNARLSRKGKKLKRRLIGTS